jgi:DNA (cytosine-5)-methyltransferase 1
MNKAYYNEIDPKAAAWLRELIKRNLIAQGDVDERSIKLVQPNDLRRYTQCHFFAGIGVWSYALRQAGWPDDFPVWTGSCPSQSFSAAGKRKGFDDERHLWPDWFRLVRECQPKYVFGEQVSSKDSRTWLDLVHDNMENEGYAVGTVDSCACGVGAPVSNVGRRRRVPERTGVISSRKI